MTPQPKEPKVTEEDNEKAVEVTGFGTFGDYRPDVLVKRVAAALSSERHRIQEKYEKLHEAAKKAFKRYQAVVYTPQALDIYNEMLEIQKALSDLEEGSERSEHLENQ